MKFSLKHEKYFNLLKPLLIMSVIFILVASIVVGVWGFNAGFDFTGGTELVVGFANSNIDITKDEDFNTARDKIEEILSKSGVKVNSFQVQGVYDDIHFVITFKTPRPDVMQDIRLKINEEFNNSEEYMGFKSSNSEISIIGASTDLTRNTTDIDSLIVRNSYLSAISATMFALALISIYACIRFKSAGAATMIIFAIFDVLMTLVFTALSRIEINAYLFSVLTVILMASIYGSADFFFGVKEIYSSPKYAESNNVEIANMIVGSSWNKNMMMYFFAFLISLIFGVFNVSTLLHTALATFAGLVIVSASHTFMLPQFWSTVCKVRPIAKGAMLYRDLGSIKEKTQNKVENKQADTPKENKDIQVEIEDLK